MQRHLNKTSTINLGSFYTPKHIVDIAYKMLRQYANLSEYLLFDSSCGYGDFFTQNLTYLGADIDFDALKECKRIHPNAIFLTQNTMLDAINFFLQHSSNTTKSLTLLHTNSLLNVNRKHFHILPTQKLIIIGNPPYNDKTSLLHHNIKHSMFDIDLALRHRDLGICFLRSFVRLKPTFICVLHPLSYLIKKANFQSLKDFTKSYRLIDALLISSQVFSKAKTFFPIVIALYQQDDSGMDYEFIKNYHFKTKEGKKLRLNDFDFISNYVTKYPNKRDKREAVAYFHTLRDINALKRNQTFISKASLKNGESNAVRVFKENLAYYCYIHHFKQYANKLPYYFGNLDVFINHNAFIKIADRFLDLKGNKAIESYFNHLFKPYCEST